MSSTQLRQSVLPQARRIVVKLGTQLLTHPDRTGLDLDYLHSIAVQIADMRRRRFEITLVSSGAIGSGCAELGLDRRPKDVACLQAVAAVGQRLLITQFHDAFAAHGLHVAQLLLTRSDFDDRVRFLNIRNCVTHLQKLGCIPVINENDTVAVDELRFGDNDLLAAMITNALPADVLILLTIVDGVMDDRGRQIDLVENPATIQSIAHTGKSPLGSGGMPTKLEAARLVTEAGETAVIAHGREKNVLQRILAAEQLGTVFLPSSRKLDSRRRWIGLTKRPAGTVTIDAGAVAALAKRGKSLLASGVRGSTGQFHRGEVLMIRDEAGAEIGRGLTNYDTDELRLIMGKRSSQFEKILGRKAYAEVVHHNNLVLRGRRKGGSNEGKRATK